MSQQIFRKKPCALKYLVGTRGRDSSKKDEKARDFVLFLPRREPIALAGIKDRMIEESIKPKANPQ
jgi:hypothetical protein